VDLAFQLCPKTPQCLPQTCEGFCGGPGVCTGDFNVDGIVNGEDLGLLLLNWGGCRLGTPFGADCFASQTLREVTVTPPTRRRSAC
jgi:hypothetical protein